MAKIKVTVNLDKELNQRWNNMAKKHKLSKSAMIGEYLEKILPILEKKTANQMMAEAMRQMAVEIDTTASLFDQSVEDYKDMKRG